MAFCLNSFLLTRCASCVSDDASPQRQHQPATSVSGYATVESQRRIRQRAMSFSATRWPQKAGRDR
jgi:hypothetical protein